MWRNYNQALAQRRREEIQLYVNRQKQLASEAASAPLQQQIADLNKLIADQQSQLKKLHDQMQTDAAEAVASKSAAHNDGLWTGVGDLGQPVRPRRRQTSSGCRGSH